MLLGVPFAHLSDKHWEGDLRSSCYIRHIPKHIVPFDDKLWMYRSCFHFNAKKTTTALSSFTRICFWTQQLFLLLKVPCKETVGQERVTTETNMLVTYNKGRQKYFFHVFCFFFFHFWFTNKLNIDSKCEWNSKMHCIVQN